MEPAPTAWAIQTTGEPTTGNGQSWSSSRGPEPTAPPPPPRRPELRCIDVADLKDVVLRDGPWLTLDAEHPHWVHRTDVSINQDEVRFG